MVQINFDASTVEPAGSYDLLPEGEYVVSVESCEMKQSKASGDQYLQFKFVVMQGEYTKRLIFHNINKWSKNEMARQIADRELSAICHATGIIKPRDTAELVGIPMLAKITIEKDKTGQYGDKNKIKWFKNRKEKTLHAVPAQSSGSAGESPWG